MAEAPDDPRIGTVIAERYRLDALLGVGGMGRVYAAEHVLMKKRVAVKVLHRELTLVPELVARFEREAMAAANIDHPNVAGATDFGRLPDGAVFLVLEFVEGKSLRDEIGAGPLPADRAARIARQIAAGLGSAHDLGIVHRDLKPENVMLVVKGGEADFVKVLDFGIAKVPIGEVPSPGAQGQPITKAGMVFGTPEYMSPEQALGQPVDGRSDLYGLGVMLFEMLSGVRPFPGDSAVRILGMQLSNPPPRISERAPAVSVPEELQAVVLHLLARDRDQRFENAEALITALDRAIAPPPPRRGKTPQISARAPLVGGAGVSGRGRALRQASRVLSRARAGMGTASERLVAGVRKLASRLPPRLSRVAELPGWALLGAVVGSALVVVLAVIGLSSAVLSSGPTPFAGALASAEPEPRLALLEPSGKPSVGAPASATAVPSTKSAPTRARELVTQAEQSLLASRLADAQKALDEAIAGSPSLAEDDRVVRILMRTAQSSKTADAAFAILEGPSGARGAEALWDLAAAPKTSAAARRRAGAWLRSAVFRRVAPPPLLIAADLRTARSCAEAHQLLATAKDVGDARSLGQLEAWTLRTGCGKKRQEDCMPCLRKDDRLDDALAAIRARSEDAGAR